MCAYAQPWCSFLCHRISLEYYFLMNIFITVFIWNIDVSRHRLSKEQEKIDLYWQFIWNSCLAGVLTYIYIYMNMSDGRFLGRKIIPYEVIFYVAFAHIKPVACVNIFSLIKLSNLARIKRVLRQDNCIFKYDLSKSELSVNSFKFELKIL